MIQRTVQKQAGCVEQASLFSSVMRVDGEYAAGVVDARCAVLVDDGTLGRSCRSILGCPKKVNLHKRCELRFQWKAEWVIDNAQCSIAPNITTLSLYDKMLDSSKPNEALLLADIIISGPSFSREAKASALEKLMGMAQKSLTAKDWLHSIQAVDLILHNTYASEQMKTTASSIAQQAHAAIDKEQALLPKPAQQPEEIPAWLKEKMPKEPTVTVPTSCGSSAWTPFRDALSLFCKSKEKDPSCATALSAFSGCTVRWNVPKIGGAQAKFGFVDEEGTFEISYTQQQSQWQVTSLGYKESGPSVDR